MTMSIAVRAAVHRPLDEVFCVIGPCL